MFTIEGEIIRLLNLMLHDDWEIYGDGSGDPGPLMFEPAKKILEICDNYNAKYTFYAELGQQLNMLNSSSSRYKKCARAWEEIMKDAVKRGHDVQLHFHPQWIGAELRDGRWVLDYTKWNAGKVELELLDEWIGTGVAYLKNLLKPVSSDYAVLSFRAGGWMCQPSLNLYTVLKKYGIVCDVSIIKGRYKKFSDGGRIDFTNAYSKFEPWEVDPNNFAIKKDGSGFWELPVYSEISKLPQQLYLLRKSFRPLYYYNIMKKRRLQKGGGDYSPQAISYSGKDYYGSFGYMHYKHLYSYVRNVKKYQDEGGNGDHLIFLTHSKSFLDYDNFDLLLSCLNRNNEISFINTRDYVRKKFVNM